MRTARRTILIGSLLLGAATLCMTVRFEIRGDFEGIYLLQGTAPLSLVVADDVLHNDQRRLLYALALQPHSSLFSIPVSHADDNQPPSFSELSGLEENEPTAVVPPAGGNKHFVVDWHERTGRGYVAQFFPDGSRLVTSFSRYHQGNGEVPSGLFVGGNLPLNLDLPGRARKNASGMTYFDGKRWNHIWCDVNEAIIALINDREVPIPPARWRFLGSRLVRDTGTEVVIESSHAVTWENVSLRVDRYAYFSAGTRYFVLANRITNVGNAPANFTYGYGDEPWLGNYGSSRGDVGWTVDSLVTRETQLDLARNSFAGMYDVGNDLLNEGHNFTRLASFIDWSGGEAPDQVFFSNDPGEFAPHKNSPLSSDTRFIGIQWGPKTLPPGGSKMLRTAIGMANTTNGSTLPVKPAVTFPADNTIALAR